MKKCPRNGTKQSTSVRGENKLGRGFMDLGEPKVAESIGRKLYTLIVRDGFYGIRGCISGATRRTSWNC